MVKAEAGGEQPLSIDSSQVMLETTVMPPSDDEVLTDYSEDGVDLTLIRWMLALSPAERLAVLEGHVDDILRIRALNADR